MSNLNIGEKNPKSFTRPNFACPPKFRRNLRRAGTKLGQVNNLGFVIWNLNKLALSFTLWL